MQNKKKELTAEELRWEEVNRKIQDEKYANQAYSKDTYVTIPGVLFAEILQMNYQHQKVLDQIANILRPISSQVGQMANDIDNITASGDLFTLRLSEYHMEFVDKGMTNKIEKDGTDNPEGDNASN
jgi:hypothetical protein